MKIALILRRRLFALILRQPAFVEMRNGGTVPLRNPVNVVPAFSALRIFVALVVVDNGFYLDVSAALRVPPAAEGLN